MSAQAAPQTASPKSVEKVDPLESVDLAKALVTGVICAPTVEEKKAALDVLIQLTGIFAEPPKNPDKALKDSATRQDGFVVLYGDREYRISGREQVGQVILGGLLHIASNGVRFPTDAGSSENPEEAATSLRQQAAGSIKAIFLQCRESVDPLWRPMLADFYGYGKRGQNLDRAFFLAFFDTSVDRNDPEKLQKIADEAQSSVEAINRLIKENLGLDKNFFYRNNQGYLDDILSPYDFSEPTYLQRTN